MDDALAQLELLYRDIAPALLAYFRRQPALAGAAEDLLQDTFVRALRRLDQVRGSVTPRAYLFGIARYVGLDALRARHPVEGLSANVAAPAAAREDARLESLRDAIAALPDAHRETLLLKLQHDLSYAEIAEVLAIPVGTVRSRLHHAVAALRCTLNSPSQHET
jgi:RNA polymerase sigma-70 factor, ECF subfamily